MLEKPNKNVYSVDVVDVIDDPLHNVSVMGKCRF
jgi:hypothetical protein